MMNIQKLLWVYLFRSVVGLISIVVILLLIVQGMYWHYLNELPEDMSPSKSEYNELLRDALWVASGNSGEIYKESSSPIGFILNSLDILAPNLKMYGLAAPSAFILLNKADPEHRRGFGRRYIIASLWISQHWTAKEALNTQLDLGFYGHGYYGIAMAARRYLDKTPDQLTPQEAFLLIAIPKAPSMLEPYCHSDRLLKQANYLIKLAAQNWKKYSHLKPLDEIPLTLMGKIKTRHIECSE